MSNNILVNFGAVEEGAQGIHASHSRLDDILNQMESKLNGIRDRWDGKAQLAYAEAQTQWDKAAFDLNGLLQLISTTVSRSGQGYQETDQNAAKLFGS